MSFDTQVFHWKIPYEINDEYYIVDHNSFLCFPYPTIYHKTQNILPIHAP